MKINRVWLVGLSVLVLISLALNAYLVSALVAARNAALDTLGLARNNMAAFSEEAIVIPIKIDQDIPFNMVIPINQTVAVPLNFDYPLSTTVNTSVNIPVLGRQNITFPVDTVIPIHYTVDVPIQVDFPISLTYRLQTEFPVTVEIPLEIRVALDNVLLEIEEGLK